MASPEGPFFPGTLYLDQFPITTPDPVAGQRIEQLDGNHAAATFARDLVGRQTSGLRNETGRGRTHASAPIDHRVAIRRGVEHLAEVRDVVGPDFDIIVEAHGKPTPYSAVEFCNRVEEFRPFWVEEVTQLENEVLEEVRQIRAQTKVPLATGERLTSRYHFAPLCSERLVDVIMPDVVHVGGISELRKIAILAEAFRVDVSPHNPQSEVSTLASMHVCMSTPNCTILEVGSGQDPFWEDLFYGGHFSYEKGYANPPSRPGLGIDLDEKVAAKFPYQEKDWSTLQTPDGAYVDR